MKLNAKFPHFDIKKALIYKFDDTFVLKLTQTIFNQADWRLIINFARFITFGGDPVELTNANNKVYSEEGATVFGVDMKIEEFCGSNMPPVDTKSEIIAWNFIRETAKSSLDNYP